MCNFLLNTDIYDKYELQKTASRIVKNKRYCFVFDEPGCGKTISAGYSVADILNEKSQPKVLIICPTNKRVDWSLELYKAFGISSTIIRKKIDIYKLKSLLYSVCIISNKSGEVFNSLTKSKVIWDLIIVDEAHEALNKWGLIKICEPDDTHKNDEVETEMEEQDYKNALNSKKVMMLTATPIKGNLLNEANNELEILCNVVSDILVIDETLDVEERSFSFTSKDIACLPQYMIYNSGKNAYKDDSCTRLKENVDFTLFFKEDFKADYKCDRVVIPIEYEQSDEKFNDEIKFLESDGLFSQFKKFQYNEKKAEIIMEKIKEEVIKNNNRCIVIAEVKSDLKKLYQKVISDAKGLLVKQIDTDNSDNISRDINSVDKDGTISALLITDKSGSTGVNLGNFDVVINLSLPWTSANLEQRFGRIDRINNSIKTKKMYYFLEKNNSDLSKYLFIKCVSKAQMIAEFMPIRNTVLINQQVLKTTYEAVLETINMYQNILDNINSEDLYNAKKEKEKIEINIKNTIVILNKILGIEKIYENFRDVIVNKNLENIKIMIDKRPELSINCGDVYYLKDNKIISSNVVNIRNERSKANNG
ncbi:helicase-related protein [Tepidibacter sp. Z1-5]|uniref:helicase-related protein n=1 Tax=Tepidibacter sp. Z1-5 TaxID=3134138 RepID=UPI0030C22EF8